ncbi:MAG: glycosyltransferase family 2 protein [Candidatus Binatia bacterium]
MSQPKAQGTELPVVSVVVPTYNRSIYIRETLDSVLRQTFSNFEVIVVDDGSTDETETVLRPYLDQIRYIRQENGGAAAARNSGVRNARGAFIAFMDSDDLSTPHHLESLYNFLTQNRDYAMVIGNGAYLEGEFHNRRTVISLRVARRLEKKGVTVGDVFDGRVVRLQGTMMRKSALEEIGLLDEWFRLSYDLDLALRLIKNQRIGFINEVVYLYRKHAGNISADDELRSRESLRALDKLTADYPEAPELIGRRAFFNLYAHRYYRLAKALAAKGHIKGASEAIRKAASLCPFSLKYRLYQLRWI